MTHQITGEDRLKLALAPLYTDKEVTIFTSYEQRELEAERVHTCMSGRPSADRLLWKISPHRSCQLSALRNVLLTLAQEAEMRITAMSDVSGAAACVVA
jgi:hypothetical protein